ncbi:MAG: ABC transporter ATP-binding protein [Pleurocapsa sp. SU_196_0]|nr:ABC transporter ATP-binding protein [Pleurocapsa sp. SU_196_0]
MTELNPGFNTASLNIGERRKRQLEESVDVHFKDIRKSFGEVEVLKGINLEIRRGEFFSLLGPSGCGKTTLLRILAGFEFQDSGEVVLRGTEVSKLPPNRRSVNTVFQNYALFPHMSVFDNVAFGLRMQKVPNADIRERVGRALETVEIGAFAARRPTQLSGGQRQRVALARAIVNEPQVLLLDEPLSALDRKLRVNLQVELMRLQARLGLTFIFVTHDQEEALTMSDRVAVMNKGVIEQLGGVEEMYERPANAYVAKFLGSSNLLEGTVSAPNRVRTALGELEVTDDLPTIGKEVMLSIRPEKIQLSRDATSVNCVSVTVTDDIYQGATGAYRAQTKNGVELEINTMNTGLVHTDYNIGDTLHAHLPPNLIVALRGSSALDAALLEGR